MRALILMLPLALASFPTLAQDRAGGNFSAAVLPGAEREAFQKIPWEKIPRKHWDRVRSGRSLTRQTWVISPSLAPRIAGLGPTYNRPSCLSCHPAMAGAKYPPRPATPCAACWSGSPSQARMGRAARNRNPATATS